MIQKIFLFVIACSLGFSVVSAQEADKVFVIGEDEKSYEALNESYKQSLLEACENDMVGAFEKWIVMTQEMEAYANRINYDIRGVKVWFHVFFEADGSIKHIGYLLRNESRNINPDEFRGFLSSFMNRYQLPVKSNQRFSHYSIASFPVYSESANK